jgi:hypothetical protein
MRAVAGSNRDRRRVLVEIFLPLQQVPQRSATVRAAVAIAVKHDKVAFFQVDGR